MATLLHVTGEGHEPLAAFAGHLVRNLEWDRYSPDSVDAAVDTVVASPLSPSDALQLVVDLRGSGRAHEVVLVSDGTAGWSSVALAFEGVRVVEGVEELRRVLGGEGAAPPVEAVDLRAVEVGDPRRHVPRGGTRGMLRERLGDGTAALTQTMREFDRRLEADGLRDVAPSVTVDPPAPGPATVEDPSWAPSAPTVADDPPAPPAPRSGSGTRRGRRESSDPDTLVPALLAVADRLYGVRETGTAVASHVQELVGVDAVAVLVPDGPLWVVAGAVGTRHLEERLTLASDHWLVHEVSEGQHGVIVEDTDIVRTRLAGAPLAAWPHLMACPLTEVSGVVVLARSDNGPAFTSRDLARASQALDEAGPLFASSVQVRELARRLRTFAELDDPGFA